MTPLRLRCPALRAEMEGTLDLNSGRVGVEREDQESYLEDEDILGFVYFNFFPV